MSFESFGKEIALTDSRRSSADTVRMNGDEFRKEYTKVQKRQFIQNMLNEKFPLAPLIICVILDIFLATAAIVIQVIQIVYASSLYYIGCG
jgi:hypothetical protein